MNIHKSALGHLYTFAGQYSDVNMSKGGFPFAAAKFLPQTMATFNVEFLSVLPDKYLDKNDLITDIAKVHGEFLFIHPFREGNGRTARILANLMCRKQGYKPLKFNKEDFETYIRAIQMVADKNYALMIDYIRSIFQD